MVPVEWMPMVLEEGSGGRAVVERFQNKIATGASMSSMSAGRKYWWTECGSPWWLPIAIGRYRLSAFRA